MHSIQTDRRRQLRTTRKGYTLMELMVVIAIIGLLAAMATVGVRHMMIRGYQTTARSEVKQIETALEMYHRDHKKYPKQGELSALEGKSITTGAHYLSNGDVTDPWGNEYDFYLDDGTVVVISYGRDGKKGGEGADRDISNREND